jgi:2-oxoglutarate/2-oxoacid ferredoxin oxidoreductase subunit beta
MARALEKYLREDVETTPFCPGCGHGILLGHILRAIDAAGLDMQRMLFVSGIGCAAWIPSPHFKADTLHTLHGRALAFATGAKLANPELKVMVISGDGDLASIGGNHLIHAARRGLDLTVICANNMIYGMTGGQTAPTTPAHALTSTKPAGTEENPHKPFDLCRLVKAAGADYVARGAITRPYDLIARIRRALETPSFAFVEVLSPCPTQYGRRNRQESPAAMFDHLAHICLERSEIDPGGDPFPDDAVLLGEF